MANISYWNNNGRDDGYVYVVDLIYSIELHA